MKQKLTKKEAARVEIAQDVLKWIKPSQVKAHNNYVFSPLPCPIGEDSKKVARKIQKQGACEVCAKGALFLSTVALHNDFIFGFHPNYLHLGHGEILGRMDKIFTRKQLDLIEAAFEATPELSYEPVRVDFSDYDRFKACMFGYQYEKDIDRLRAILKNVIANKGTFKP